MQENKEDLKKDEVPSGDDQPVKEEKSLEDKFKDLEEKNKKLEDDLKKSQEDTENYKQGLIAAKAKKLSLPDEEEPEIPEANLNDKPEVKDDILSDDEKAWKEVDRRSEEKARKLMAERDKKEARNNGIIAKKEFIKAHPELLNEALCQAVFDEYTDRHGKSVEGIKLDLERAYTLYKVDNKIPLEKEDKPDVNLPNVPDGKGKSFTVVNGKKITAEEQVIKNKFFISDDNWFAWKEAVLTGKRKCDPDILKILQEQE